MNKKENKLSLRTTLAVVKDTCRYAWTAHKRHIVAMSLILLASAFMPYVASGLEALVVNYLVKIAKGAVAVNILLLAAILLGVLYVRELLNTLSRFREKLFWLDMRTDLELAFSKKMVSLDVATHEDPVFQDELQVLNEYGGSHSVSNLINAMLYNIQNLAGFIIASSIIIAFDWRFFVLLIFAGVPRFLSELRYGKSIWSIYQSKAEDRRLYREYERRMEEKTSIRELQMFQNVSFFATRQKELLERFVSSQKKEEKKNIMILLSTQAISLTVIGVCVYFLLGRVAGGAMQIGTFLFAFGTLLRFEGEVSGFFFSLARQHKDARVVKSYFEIRGREPKVSRARNRRSFNITSAPTIEFRNVSFCYPSRSGEYSLRNFSLVISPGERFAVVGANGAGKSTLVKLLCRFYDHTEGAVLINGIDLREIDVDDWYKYLALLSQDFAVYKLKTWEFVSLGRMNGERNQKKIEHAAARSRAHQFINTWKDRYDSQIGVEFKGVEVSHGQRQKLALARALYRDAFVTILDEPTAHVDVESEQMIFDALEKEIDRNRTLILISHRFSTVRNADRICVFSNGAVGELGSHDELVRKGGIYAKLFEEQARAYRS